MRDSFGVISIGVAEITEYAVKYLQLNIKNGINIENLIDLSLKIAWQKKVSLFPDDIDPNDSKFHATFLAGGIISGTAFLTSISRNCKANLHKSTIIDPDPYALLIGHPEQELAGKFCNELLADSSWRNIKNKEERNSQIIECAVKTIKFMEEIDESIGGTIRYSVIQKKQPIYKGKIEGNTIHKT